MGRLGTFLAGIVVVGAGVVLRVAKQVIFSYFGEHFLLPVDYGQLMDLGGYAIMALGGLIMAYAVVAAFVSILWRSFKSRGKQKREQIPEEYVDRRRRDYYEDRDRRRAERGDREPRPRRPPAYEDEDFDRRPRRESAYDDDEYDRELPPLDDRDERRSRRRRR